MASSILIIAVGLATAGVSTLLAFALAHAAAHADSHSERILADYAREALHAIRPPRTSAGADYAGLAAAHETISREPSITVPSSSTSVGTIRLPVRRSTS